MATEGSLKCGRCGEVVLKSVGSSLKLRSKVVVFKPTGETVAVCKGCNNEVVVPVQVDEPLLKAMNADSTKNVRLFVRS